jgi:hypothetical protein
VDDEDGKNFEGDSVRTKYRQLEDWCAIFVSRRDSGTVFSFDIEPGG